MNNFKKVVYSIRPLITIFFCIILVVNIITPGVKQIQTHLKYTLLSLEIMEQRLSISMSAQYFSMVEGSQYLKTFLNTGLQEKRVLKILTIIDENIKNNKSELNTKKLLFEINLLQGDLKTLFQRNEKIVNLINLINSICILIIFLFVVILIAF